MNTSKVVQEGAGELWPPIELLASHPYFLKTVGLNQGRRVRLSFGRGVLPKPSNHDPN